MSNTSAHGSHGYIHNSGDSDLMRLNIGGERFAIVPRNTFTSVPKGAASRPHTNAHTIARERSHRGRYSREPSVPNTSAHGSHGYSSSSVGSNSDLMRLNIGGERFAIVPRSHLYANWAPLLVHTLKHTLIQTNTRAHPHSTHRGRYSREPSVSNASAYGGHSHSHRSIVGSNSDLLRLNIGGERFAIVPRSTLTSVPGSNMAAMFSGRHKLRTDNRGRALIDRDARYFDYILDYLRNGNAIPCKLPANEIERRRVLDGRILCVCVCLCVCARVCA